MKDANGDFPVRPKVGTYTVMKLILVSGWVLAEYFPIICQIVSRLDNYFEYFCGYLVEMT